MIALFTIGGVACVMILIACTAMQPAVDRVVQGVQIYCTQPAAQRALLRESVNAKLAPNRVTVECAADKPTQ